MSNHYAAHLKLIQCISIVLKKQNKTKCIRLVITSYQKREQDKHNRPYQHLSYVHLILLYIIIIICSHSKSWSKELPTRSSMKHTILKFIAVNLHFSEKSDWMSRAWILHSALAVSLLRTSSELNHGRHHILILSQTCNPGKWCHLYSLTKHEVWNV